MKTDSQPQSAAEDARDAYRAMWRRIHIFEIVAIPVTYVGLFFLLLLCVNKLPFDEGTQSAVLAFAFACVGYYIMQVRKNINAGRSIRSGIQQELLRISNKIRFKERPINHNLHNLFYQHATLFSADTVARLTRLISDLDSLIDRESEENEPETDKLRADIEKQVGDAWSELY